MTALAIVQFVAIFIAFLTVWRRFTATSVATPLLIFAAFEISGVWPATVYNFAFERTDWYAATLTGAAFLAFLGGFVVISRLTDSGKGSVGGFANRPIDLDASLAAYLRVVAVLSLAMVALGASLYGGGSFLVQALTGFLMGESQLDVVTQLSAQREELTKGYYFGETYSGQGLILQVLQVGWPYVTILAASVAKATSRREWWVLTVVLLLLSFVYVGAAARFQLVQVLLTFLIGLNLITKFTLKRALLAGTSLMVLVVAVAPLSMQTAEIDIEGGALTELAISMRDRILLGDGVHNLEVIAFTADGSLPFGWGRYHLEKALTALPGVTVGVPLAQQLQAIRTGNPMDTSFASMTYLGVLYADFGPLGPLVGYLLIGGFVAWLHGALFRRNKSVPNVALASLMIMSVGGLTIGSSVSAAATFAVVLVIHVSVLFLFVVFRGKGVMSRVQQAGLGAQVGQRRIVRRLSQ